MRLMMLLAFAAVASVGGAATWFTSAKLHRMEQIQGTKPGALVEMHVVLAKAPTRRGNVWVLWQEGDISRRGNHRLSLPRRVADRHELGDQIEIVHVPGLSMPFHREGTFASKRNFMFDRVLLVLEVIVTLVGLLGMPVSWWAADMLQQRARGSEPSPGPPSVRH